MMGKRCATRHFVLALIVGISHTDVAASHRRASNVRPWIGKSVPLSIRGGNSYATPGSYGIIPPYNNRNPADSPLYHSPQNEQQQYRNEQYNDPLDSTMANENDPFQETVQDRVDHWRSQQQEHASELQSSPRDEKGRMKLLTSVGKGSRAFIFFMLMWRDVHLYEVASRIQWATGRMIVTVPLVTLFILNMAGAVSSMTSPSHSGKKRLKAILNLDKLIEMFLVLFAVIRLTIWPNKYTPREQYITNILHSAFFLLQCQAFTRLSWDENSAQPMSSYSQTPQQYGRQPESAYMQEDDWYEPGPN